MSVYSTTQDDIRSIYLEQIVSTSTLLWVDLEGKVEEVAEDGRQLVLILDLRCSICSNEPQRSQWAFRQVWWFAFDHLNRHDTERPDIDLATILLASDDFWSHPVWSADHGSALHVGFVYLSAEAEIGQFDVSFQ